MYRCPMCDDIIDLTLTLPIVEVTIKHQYKNKLNMQVSPVQIETMTLSLCPDCCTKWIALGQGKKHWGMKLLDWFTKITKGRVSQKGRHYIRSSGKV